MSPRPGIARRALHRAQRLVGEALGVALRGLPAPTRLAARERARHVARLDHPAATVLLAVDNDIELRIRLRSCAKEPETVAWLDGLREAEVLYDVGANVGAYSLVAAIARRARVVAFEPGPATYARLCENVILNRAGHLVTPLPFALSDATAVHRFDMSAPDAGAAKHVLRAPLPEAGFPAASQAVAAARLDDVRSWFGLPAPNLLKIDVDGPELRVLAGAAETLADPALRSALVECSPADADAVERCLASHGFRVRARHAQGDGANVIFDR